MEHKIPRAERAGKALIYDKNEKSDLLIIFLTKTIFGKLFGSIYLTK